MKLTRIALTFALAAAALDAAPRIKFIKLSVGNPGAIARTENVVVAVGQMKRIDPGFNAGNAIVVATNAASLEEDARVLQATELPSQADDLDGDGKYDELVFQIDLGAGQTRMVTIAYGEQAAIQRLRGKYPPRTAMQFATRYEGLGWESEDIAWRIYFDKRNAIDIYGKRRPGLYLDLFAQPEYVYHLESPLGRDIFKVDPTLGAGSVAAIVNGKATRWPMSPNASGACWRAGPCAPSANTNSRVGSSAARRSIWSAASPSGQASMAFTIELP